MANPYDALAAGLQPQGTPATDNPYDAIVEDIQVQQQQRARTVYEKALATNPDQAAESQRLAKQTGLPTDAVERNLEEVRRKEQARLLDLYRMAQESPVLARQLSDPNFTKQAHDDLGALEQVGNFFTNTGKAAKAGVFSASRGAAGVFQAGAEFVAPVLDPLESVTAIGGNPLRRLAEGFAEIGGAAGKTVKATAPKGDGNVESGYYSGIQSLTQNLLALPMAFLPGGQGAALGMMTASTGGQSYQDAREKGLSMSQALPFAASQAAIEYATEKLPLGQLLGDVKAGTGILKTLAKQMALEIPGEQVATILQDMNEWAVLNPEKPFADYIAERPDAAAQTLVATIVGTGGNVVVAKGIEKATRTIMGDAYDAGLADQSAEQLQTAMQNAAQSMLRQRNPEEFRNLMQQMAENTEGAPQEVFVDAEVLNQLPQDVLQQLPENVLAQLADALAANDVVGIPVADVLTIAPGTPLEQAVIENARIGDPMAMTQAEAKIAGEQAQQYLAQEAERVIRQATDQQAMQESSDRVRQTLLDQLNAVGRDRPAVNETTATLYTSMFTTLAGQLGTTPEAVFAEWGPKIVGQTGALGQGDTLDQDGLAVDNPTEWTPSLNFDGSNAPAEKKQIVMRSADGSDIGRVLLYRNQKETIVSDIQVRPEYERQGVATRLMDEAFTETNADYMHVESGFTGKGWDFLQKYGSVQVGGKYAYARRKKLNQSAPFDGSNPDIRYSKSGVNTATEAIPVGEELIAIHNLSQENLLFADQMGGIPVPSIGITKASTPFTGFGEITLIASKDMIDPASGVPVFDRDAYTARFPTLNYKKVTAKKADAFYDRMKPSRDLGDDGSQFMSMLWESIKNDSVQSPDKVSSQFQRYTAPRMLYIKEVLGKDVKLPMVPVEAREFFGHMPSWVKFVKSADWSKDNLGWDNPERVELHKAAGAAAKRAAQEYVDKIVADGDTDGMRSYFQEMVDKVTEDDGRIPYGTLDRAKRDAGTFGTKRIDGTELAKRVDKIVSSKDPAYLRWVTQQMDGLFAEPTITLRGKEVEPSLDNIVEAMSIGAVNGAEKTMTSGDGKTAAAVGKRFKSVKEIQDARSQVVSSEQESVAKESAKQLLESYRSRAIEFFTQTDWRGQIDTWAGFDAAMEALAKAGKKTLTDGNIRVALQSKGFRGVDQEVIDLARQSIGAIRSTATDYFEAKPQRAVSLSEFRGALVPKGADQRVLEILEANGIKVVEYNRKTEGDRDTKFQKLAKALNKGKDVLFSKGNTEGTLTTAQATNLINQALGDNLGKALVDSGLVTFTNKGGEYQGATFADGTIVLNLDALTADNFAGVLEHEAWHSMAKELLGEETYSKILSQLEKNLKAAKGNAWVTEANQRAIDAGTKPKDVTDEIAAYAIEQYRNGAKLPGFVTRWVQSFLSALRSAIIQRMPNGKMASWAITNIKPEDLSRLAVAGLRAKAQGLQAQGREAMAYSQLFSKIDQIAKAFEARITAAFDKGRTRNPIIVADNTPSSMQMFGWNDKKIIINFSELEKIGNKGGFETDAKIASIVHDLRRPALMFWNTKTNSLNFMRKGDPNMMIGVTPNANSGSSHLVLTAHFLNGDDVKSLQSKISRGELVLLYKGTGVPGISGLAEMKQPQ